MPTVPPVTRRWCAAAGDVDAKDGLVVGGGAAAGRELAVEFQGGQAVDQRPGGQGEVAVGPGREDTVGAPASWCAP
jgi:hypothetical protein